MLIPSVRWNFCRNNCAGSIGPFACQLNQDALLYGGLMAAAILDVTVTRAVECRLHRHGAAYGLGHSDHD